MPTANPFANTLFVPTISTLGSLLGTALIGIAIAERRHLRELHHRSLFQPWVTWCVLTPAFALSVLSGELTTLLFFSALVFLGLREYIRLVGLPGAPKFLLMTVGLAIGPVALLSRDLYLALPPLLLLVATLPPLLAQDVQAGTRHLAFAALGFGYLPWLLGHALLLYADVPGGPGILLALGPAVALSDVGAFTVGRLFGQHKLAPRLSPNKTWEGFAGNIAGAYLGLALMHFALPALSLLLVLPPVVALGALWGDLLESLMKREFAVKDVGTLLPGMGGVLDRIDSLIVVVPLAYYCALVF